MSDNLFHEMLDVWVITRKKGVYRQSKVYRRGGKIYAAACGGFVQLFGAKGTSAPDVSWVEFQPADAVKSYRLDLGYGPGVSVEDVSPAVMAA